MLKQFPVGYDLTLMNTLYHYPKKLENNKWDKGSMSLVVKDNNTGEKHVIEVENPTYEYYYAKDDVLIENNLFFIEKEKTDLVSVPFTDLEKDIAERTGNLEFYYDNIKNGNRRANSVLHTHPRVFMSDSNIEDNYRFRFSNSYTNNISPISKAFFDIEARITHMKGDFPEMGECPIDLITLINENTNMIYTLVLRDETNPQIAEFEEQVKNGTIFKELKDFIITATGGKYKAAYYGTDKLDIQFQFYDEKDEIKLIKDLFNLINILEPDFILAWNMPFDMPYIIQRVTNLGYDPRDVICHPDFVNKKAMYFVDNREDKKNNFAERGDYASVSSKSIFMDQLQLFASRRKGQSSFASFKLDDIGYAIAGVKKYNYHHITTKLKELASKSFKTYVFYNIMDTIVQKCIEKKTGDVDFVFGKAISNNTRYSKVHRQTVYLANRAVCEFYNEGFILGNNCNRQNEKPPKFPGAFVADPLKVSDYSKIKVNGIPIQVFNNLDDFDYARLYPSVLQEFNMAPNTQVGKLEILEQVHDKENRYNNPDYTRGGAFIEDLQSGVYLEFASRWFHLAGYEELYDDIIEYYNTIKNSARSLRYFTPDGRRIVIHKYNPDLLISPISKDIPELRRVINKFAIMPNDMKDRIYEKIN
jgi:hypothetical protein